MPGQPPTRRSPKPTERKRDPDRTRERLLQAAVVEFGEHGYAGARVSAIARRAGVNQQLIAYYFDGKAGLYRALTERWRATSTRLSVADQPLAEVVTGFLARTEEHRQWARLLAWEGLTGETGDDGSAGSYFAAMVGDLERRQQAGEIAADLAPASLLLMLFAAALAPVVLPQVVRGTTGKAADSPDFLDAYADQLRLVIHRLKGPA